MRRSGPVVGLFAVAALAACAHAPEPVAAAPDYRPLVGEPAPAHARLYADCIAQAAANQTYRRAHDPDTELILFTCTGAPARTFYDALETRSAAVGSRFEVDGRLYRSTEPVIRDLFGVDSCSVGTEGDARCVLTFNAGDFLAGD
jgi:hypothetical protein